MQLVTVHGLHNGFVIPLVFCLATGKTIGHYRQIIQHLKNEVRRRSHARLHPRRVVCDFEQSLLIAIQTELPTTRVSGCFFPLHAEPVASIARIGPRGALPSRPALEAIRPKGHGHRLSASFVG